MLNEYKLRINLAVGIGFFMSLVGSVMANGRIGQDFLLAGKIVSVLSIPIYIYGLSMYAKAKKRYWAWGLLGFFNLFGLIMLYFLRDNSIQPYNKLAMNDVATIKFRGRFVNEKGSEFIYQFDIDDENVLRKQVADKNWKIVTLDKLIRTEDPYLTKELKRLSGIYTVAGITLICSIGLILLVPILLVPIHTKLIIALTGVPFFAIFGFLAYLLKTERCPYCSSVFFNLEGTNILKTECSSCGISLKGELKEPVDGEKR